MIQETNVIVTKVHARKCKSGKVYRYRYKLKGDNFLNKDLTIPEITAMDAIEFSFAPSMTDSDQEHVKKRFEAKLVA